ncbi:MAG: VWA domain-containing protein [Deltaproteobacteria bacterium]|nr:VWA domain-containing protein [Deltaproteobacteria bacterium]
MSCGLLAGAAHADGTPPVLTAKTLPDATIQLIDPETGTSAGGGGSDVRVAVGDVILFKFKYVPVPDNYVHGVNGYLTEYIPANTEVVGVRLTDAAGLTRNVRRPGLSFDGCGGNCGADFSLPSSTGTRTVLDGSLAGVLADAGFFFSTDTRTARTPGNVFITLMNGLPMSPTPQYSASIALLLGATGGLNAHNAWDLTQVNAYGIQGAASGNSGKGNTPFGYGSPVAGPQSHYSFEATGFAAAPTIRFNDTVGPWQRARSAESWIGTGAAATGTGLDTRVDIATTTFAADPTPRTPLPFSTTGGPHTQAVRIALGETYVGEPGFAEVALRVRALPLDPVQNADVDCGEMFGTDTTSTNVGARGKDNSWGFYLGSPACVFLNLLYDLSVDRTLAGNGDRLTYTLRAKNLSTNPVGQTNVQMRLRFDSSRMAFVSASGGGTQSTCGASACVVWPTIARLAPSEERTFTIELDVGGVGQNTNAVFADYISTQIPSYTTQAITVVRDLFVPTLTLAPQSASVASPGSVVLSGTLSNTGTGGGTLQRVRLLLPVGGTLGGTPARLTIGTVQYTCDSNCAGSQPEFRPAVSIAEGISLPFSFTMDVPGAVASGLYPVTVQLISDQSMGLSGDFEHNLQNLTYVPIGQPRTAAPVLSCPIDMGDIAIRGTSSAPDGTLIRVFFNGIERGLATVAAGNWTMTGFLGSFGSLYGGLEIRASADGATTLESDLSATCFARPIPACVDGKDNDGDGAIDFPGDPGCDSPTDNDETNVVTQCADGGDNDGDMLVDLADPGCQDASDTTESGPAACGDGADNDGDTLIDFPSDPGCTSATDNNEISFPACMDGIDNDGDLLFDYPSDPGCHASNDTREDDPALDPTTPPRLLLLFDTSGSMNLNNCAALPAAQGFTGGDGSTECPGSDVACATCGANGCGNTRADDARLFQVKQGITNAVAAFGEVEYGLMRFHQRAAGFSCPGANLSLRSGGWQGAGASPCSGFASGDAVVGFSPDNAPDLLTWLDGRSNYPGTPPPSMDFELRGSGTTPLAGILSSAQTYLAGVRAADPRGACRPYRVVLITDGLETCGGDPLAAARALRTAGYLVHVIGFADNTLKGNLDAIAAEGGTTSAIIVSDPTNLSLAVSQIVSSSIRIEICNNLDDNCNNVVDEGFVKYCNLAGSPAVATQTLCADPGDPCNGVDDNCQNGILDEVKNACGQCGPVPAEICNGLDDDCNGFIDVIPPAIDVCAACRPSTEICDGRDNDCDGRIDEEVSRSCGGAVAPCSAGTQQCIEQTVPQMMGVFGACSGIGPSPEICDNIDNDCDGVVDQITRDCGTDEGECVAGVELCVAGMFGACNDVGPSPEICNGLDDNCNMMVDEGDPGGGAACTDPVCGSGTVHCVAGRLVCQGAMMAMPETCNNRDDNCNGQVDEGLPDMGACGMPVGGECEAGRMRCVAGTYTCVGYVGPSPEVCNCLDDDCDGMVDIPQSGASLCPSGSTCTDCQCASPCGTGEFPCPSGKRCVNGFCVADPCGGVNCPPGQDGTVNTCRMGRCVTLCSTVTCAADRVCRPTDGSCVPDTCTFLPGKCAAGELCVADTCVPNPCGGVTCDANQFCRGGTCHPSCAGVSCPDGQACKDGACVATGCPQSCALPMVCDPTQMRCTNPRCGGVICDPNKTCDPLTGTCIADPCVGVTCPTGQSCKLGDCFDPSQLLPPDGGVDPGQGDVKILVTGDGGCACETGARQRGAPPGAWLLGLLGLGLFVLRARRRR